jgi:hypothetical protein
MIPSTNNRLPKTCDMRIELRIKINFKEVGFNLPYKKKGLILLPISMK